MIDQIDPVLAGLPPWLIEAGVAITEHRERFADNTADRVAFEWNERGGVIVRVDDHEITLHHARGRWEVGHWSLCFADPPVYYTLSQYSPGAAVRLGLDGPRRWLTLDAAISECVEIIRNPTLVMQEPTVG